MALKALRSIDGTSENKINFSLKDSKVGGSRMVWRGFDYGGKLSLALL